MTANQLKDEHPQSQISFELAALAANLSRRTSFDGINEVTKYFQRREVSKRSVLLTNGSRCNHFYYVASGVLRSYLRTEQGKESTIMLAFEDWWITDIDSFTTGGASVINIDVLQDSVIYGLSKRDFDLMVTTSPAFESAFRKMMQHAYIREQRRAVGLLSETAESRYLALLRRFPKLEQLTSQRIIASYLGITPEFLSVVKKKRKEKP